MNKYQKEVDRGTRWLMRFNSIHHHWELSDDLNYYDWLAGFGGDAIYRKTRKEVRRNFRRYYKLRQ